MGKANERDPDDEKLRRLLKVIEAELDEERAGQDVDPTAQEALDVRLRGLDAAVRGLMDPDRRPES